MTLGLCNVISLYSVLILYFPVILIYLYEVVMCKGLPCWKLRLYFFGWRCRINHCTVNFCFNLLTYYCRFLFNYPDPRKKLLEIVEARCSSCHSTNGAKAWRVQWYTVLQVTYTVIYATCKIVSIQRFIGVWIVKINVYIVIISHWVWVCIVSVYLSDV